jgi:branched-chain amino acid transport system permease protein
VTTAGPSPATPTSASSPAAAGLAPREAAGAPQRTRGLVPLRYAVPLAAVLLLLPLAQGIPVIGALASPFQRIQLSYGLVFAIAVLGFNLLLGYTGLLSFGHAAFFGAAAYVTGLLVKYLHAASMEVFLVAGMATGFVLAALFGIVCVRYTRYFFSILTLALSQVLWALALKFFWITNGTDGLRIPTPTLLGGLVGASGDEVRFLSLTYYYYVVVVFLVSAAVMWVVAHSPFGKALEAIRDNETRAQFVGIDIRRYRWNAFMISGVFTGLAGALWAPLNGLVTPDALHWTFSGKIVFMAVLGGFKSFAGPILGGIAYNYLETYVIKTTEYWQGLLGLILVALVLIMPQGIVGVLGGLARRWRRTA